MDGGATSRLWFDVGVKRYTTRLALLLDERLLWFDVGVKRYTTLADFLSANEALWFDVGVKRYTTEQIPIAMAEGCGLM